jgi:glutamyl-tRNA reductase
MDSMVLSDSQIISISLSRATAPVEVREQLAYQDWPSVMAAWHGVVREWAILSTCHRFELYLVSSAANVNALTIQLQEMLASVITAMSGLPLNSSDTFWHVRIGDDAVMHLCRVAAGLDSLVLGEAQIQGQVIATYTNGLESGTIGRVLSTLFRTAIRVGKRARTETAISTRAISMSSVALGMATHHVPDLATASVLVIGAGEMSRLALKSLLQRQVANVTVANRTLARAEAALLHPAWRAQSLDEAIGDLSEYDIIFSATSSPHFVVTRAHVLIATGANGSGQKQVLIDLAVPRDIDPTIRGVPGIVLVDVDDLQHGLDKSLATRTEALPSVDAILAEEIEEWRAEMREFSMRPYVVELRQRAERIRQSEVDRTMRYLGAVDDETREHIQHLSRALVNKLLHEPTVRIKELAHHDEADYYASAICDIFGLAQETDIQQSGKDAGRNGSAHNR